VKQEQEEQQEPQHPQALLSLPTLPSSLGEQQEQRRQEEPEWASRRPIVVVPLVPLASPVALVAPLDKGYSPFVLSRRLVPTAQYKFTPPSFGRERKFYDGFTVKNQLSPPLRSVSVVTETET